MLAGAPGWCGPGADLARTARISSSKLIIGAGAVKDQSVARLARADGARSQEARAIPTQKALSIHPATLVQDQFRCARPHRQPARSTARMIRPRVRSASGVAQWIV